MLTIFKRLIWGASKNLLPLNAEPSTGQADATEHQERFDSRVETELLTSSPLLKGEKKRGKNAHSNKNSSPLNRSNRSRSTLNGKANNQPFGGNFDFANNTAVQANARNDLSLFAEPVQMQSGS